jgi:hypothetical protein
VAQFAPAFVEAAGEQAPTRHDKQRDREKQGAPAVYRHHGAGGQQRRSSVGEQGAGGQQRRSSVGEPLTPGAVAMEVRAPYSDAKFGDLGPKTGVSSLIRNRHWQSPGRYTKSFPTCSDAKVANRDRVWHGATETGP